MPVGEAIGRVECSHGCGGIVQLSEQSEIVFLAAQFCPGLPFSGGPVPANACHSAGIGAVRAFVLAIFGVVAGGEV